MKQSINQFKIVPQEHRITSNFEICCYGNISDEIHQWINYHSLELKLSGKYNNIVIPDNINLLDIFEIPIQFRFMDGFSPNLNKHLHIGHLSNLVIAKAFRQLGISSRTISIYGDTLEGTDTKYVDKLLEYQEEFGYRPDGEFYASKMKMKEDEIYSQIINGELEYKGCKVIDTELGKRVLVKSNGNTTYLYQDLALYQLLSNSCRLTGIDVNKILYLTGSEQKEHFQDIVNITKDNQIKHIGLGLVRLNDNKMSSRLGNVIFIDELYNIIKAKFNDSLFNYQLFYNIFAGFILNSKPESEKSIRLDLIDNVKNSPGLYLSYTTARLYSAGCTSYISDDIVCDTYQFTDKELEYYYLLSLDCKPNLLFNKLIDYCKQINSLYEIHRIRDNEKNLEMFNNLLHNLRLGMLKLGLYGITKI